MRFALPFLVPAFLTLAAHAEKSVVAYVPNWIPLDTFSAQIDYAKLTHINVAFENPVNAAGSLSYHRKTAGLIAKAHAAGVKVLVSIGGGSASESRGMRARYFRLISTPGRRMAFANRIANYVVNHDYDGLDVDLEGPAINENYGLFITELSKVLKARGKLLTAAVSQGYGGEKVLASSFGEFDFLNIMAYDATGPWDPNNAGQHSSLEFAKANVDYWIGRGLPKAKAVLGVPFYGYGFGAAFRRDAYSYSEIVAAYAGAENSDQAGTTVWYNGIATIEAKARYAAEQELGGIMIWSLDNDAKDQRALLPAIWRGLGK
jgi:chitinase